MKYAVFVNTPFVRSGNSDTSRFFDVYFERTKDMFSPSERQEFEKYMNNSVKLSSGVTMPVYDLPEPPLWTASLAPIARKKGFSVKFLDLLSLSYKGFKLDDIQREAEKTEGDVFLFSPFTSNYDIVEQAVKCVKDAHPKSIAIAGGHHASFTDARTLNGGFDVVVRGEGERTFSQLLDAINHGSGYSGISGVSYKDGSKFVSNPDQELIKDLDTLPMMDFDMLPEIYRNLFFGRVFSSRGCPMTCSFCAESLWSRNYPRHKSAERVKREIGQMRDSLGMKFVFINDETFTTDKRYARGVSDAIHDTGYSWACQTRIDFVDRDTLRYMKERGCNGIFFGAESADQEVLDKNKKKIKVGDISKACSLAKDAGMHVCTNWLVGLAGESRKSAYKTIETVEKMLEKGLTDRVDYYICVPYPGTDLFQKPSSYKVKIRTDDFSRFREDDISVMDTEFLTAEEIHEIWFEGMKRFAVAMNRGKP